MKKDKLEAIAKQLALEHLNAKRSGMSLKPLRRVPTLWWARNCAEWRLKASGMST